MVGWLYWGFTSLQWYFTHIATWKQEITNKWKFKWRCRESNSNPLLRKSRLRISSIFRCSKVNKYESVLLPFSKKNIFVLHTLFFEIERLKFEFLTLFFEYPTLFFEFPTLFFDIQRLIFEIKKKLVGRLESRKPV